MEKTNGGNLIQIKNLVATVNLNNGDTLVTVNKANMELKRGNSYAIVGKSGSGKTSLISIIGLLNHSYQGEFLYNGMSVSTLTDSQLSMLRASNIGFVFQNFNLLPKLSAQLNVALPLVYAGVGEEERLERAKTALEAVGLGDRIDHNPTEMSGGQRQRVAIARALINDPAIIMADEPTGNLDTKSSYEIMDIFKKMNDDGKTVVMVTHEPDIAEQTKRILTMRDGKLVSDEWRADHV